MPSQSKMLSKPSSAGASSSKKGSASDFVIYDDHEYTVEEAVGAVIAPPRYKAAFHRLQLRNDKLSKEEQEKHRSRAKSVISLLSAHQIVEYYDKTYKPAPDDNYLHKDKFNELCGFLNTEDEHKVSSAIRGEIRKRGPLVIAAFNRMQAEGRYNLRGKATIEEEKK